ncbi:hypothetical protein E2I00_001230 [Balaenoptera physalus]|uniref:Uncharacterized protein n=1 Tax=Balaenoptera physalus TaxID=9770 RepID=A0A6A1QFM8_BALPH|nr:hypothetical protein E2I00_001230 [Balaenoptera physalus]
MFPPPNQQNHGSEIVWKKLSQKIKIMLKECRNKKRSTYTTRFPDGEHILLLLNNLAVNDQARKAIPACVLVSFLTILNKGHYDRPCSAETFLSIPIIFYINNAISPKPNNSLVFKKKLFES